MPTPRMRADHSIARTLSSFDANRGTSASTRASPGFRAQISSAMRSTPSGAELRSAAMTSKVRSSGTQRHDFGRIEVGLGAQPGERVPHLGREPVDLERREHFGAGAVDVTFEIRDMRARDAGRGDRAREPGVARVLDARRAPARAPSTSSSWSRAAASRKSPRSGRGGVLAHDLGPRLDLPRPVRAEQQAGDERRGRRPHRGIGRAAARELEVVERLLVAELRQELPGAVELLAARLRLRDASLVSAIGRSSGSRSALSLFDRHRAPTYELQVPTER